MNLKICAGFLQCVTIKSEVQRLVTAKCLHLYESDNSTEHHGAGVITLYQSVPPNCDHTLINYNASRGLARTSAKYTDNNMSPNYIAFISE